MIPGVDIDWDASRVEIDGVAFPAVGLICPPNPSRTRTSDWDLLLGGPDQADGICPTTADVYVPLESGALVHVEVASRTSRCDEAACRWLGLTVGVYSPTCVLDLWDDPLEGRVYLPAWLAVRAGRLVPGSWDVHDYADPDWAAEWIQRIATYPVAPLDGPRVRLVPLATVAALHAENGRRP